MITMNSYQKPRQAVGEKDAALLRLVVDEDYGAHSLAARLPGRSLGFWAASARTRSHARLSHQRKPSGQATDQAIGHSSAQGRPQDL